MAVIVMGGCGMSPALTSANFLIFFIFLLLGSSTDAEIPTAYG